MPSFTSKMPSKSMNGEQIVKHSVLNAFAHAILYSDLVVSEHTGTSSKSVEHLEVKKKISQPVYDA